MSTIHHTPTPEVDDFLERYAAFERRAAELHPANKAVLFAALSAGAVTILHLCTSTKGASPAPPARFHG